MCRAFAQECQALQPGTVHLPSGQGPVGEATCRWAGVETPVRLLVAGAPSHHTGKGITELLWKLLHEFQSLEIPWRKQMCSSPCLGVWVINTVFPEILSQKFMLVLCSSFHGTQEPIKKKKKKLSQMPRVDSLLKELSTTKLSEMECSFLS